jgi:hypothetical protein
MKPFKRLSLLARRGASKPCHARGSCLSPSEVCPTTGRRSRSHRCVPTLFFHPRCTFLVWEHASLRKLRWLCTFAPSFVLLLFSEDIASQKFDLDLLSATSNGLTWPMALITLLQ